MDDYVSAVDEDLIDLYSASDMTGKVKEIRCLQLQGGCVRHGAPDPDKVQLALRTNSTNYFSGNLTPGVSGPVPVVAYWETNPDTGVAWTKPEINALEIGIKTIKS